MAEKKIRRRTRKEFIAFHVSEEEKQAIIDGAFDCDMSISDYCRKAILGAAIIKRREIEDV